MLPDQDANELWRAGAVARRYVGGAVTGVRQLAGGEFSRAFALTAAGRDYVIRLSAHEHAASAFAKDAYAGRNFASPRLPIPRVLALGQHGGEHVALSERMPGRRLEEIGEPAREALLAPLLDVVEAIAQADTRRSCGYGAWDATGNGEAPSWRAYLTGVIHDRAAGYYRGWHALFHESFLERELYEAVYRRLLRLVHYCPEQRGLVHADLHFDNLLAGDGRITGVIDWGNACYGDPLYDVAWLGRRNANAAPFINPAILANRFGAAPHYRERLACYECFLGLDDLRFYAKTGRRQQYGLLRQHLVALMAAIDRGDEPAR